MGYGNTTQLIYGLHLDPQQSQQLRAAISTWLHDYPVGQAMLAQIGDERDIYSLLDYMSDEDEETGIRVALASEDTHSTIHSNVYEEGRFHGFGILLGDKGYASYRPAGDFVSAMKTGPSQAQQEAYQERLGSILKLAGLDAIEPSLVVVSHVS